MSADFVLSADYVEATRKAASKGYNDRWDTIALADSHGLLREDYDAMRAVAKRLCDSWLPAYLGEPIWFYWNGEEEPMTSAERRALDELEAS